MKKKKKVIPKTIPKKWRVKVYPGFTEKNFSSERTARKELSRWAERVYIDKISDRNVLLVTHVVLECDEGKGWTEYIKLNPNQLIKFHEESKVK